MKFNCESNLLQKSINIVEKAVPAKSTLPIIENLFLEIVSNQLKLRGHNLEMGIEYTMPIENNNENGKILVKARTLSSIVSKLLNENLEFNIQDQKIKIKTKEVDFDLFGTNADEYPVFPEIEKGIKVQLTLKDLKELIKTTIFAVSFDETKQFLNGILCKSENKKILFLSTDGFRLALNSKTVADLKDDFSVIIPFKAINELAKISQIFEEDTKIEMNIAPNQVSFVMNNFILVTRVIKGQFPDYKQVIPSETENNLIISRREFLDACERASILAVESNNIIKFIIDENLTINAQAPNLGEFKEKIKINRTKGKVENKIVFNVKLLLDALRIIEDDEICFEFNSNVKPCIIKGKVNNEFIYVLMPIRTNENTVNETKKEQVVASPA